MTTGETGPSQRRDELAVMIRFHVTDSDGTYGYRRIHAVLTHADVVVAPETVRSIMAEQHLIAAQPHTRVHATISADDKASRPDLVDRDVTATAPGRIWVGDITYIRTWQGFCSVATALDCCTKKAVGYAIADHMRTDLICQVLDMAVRDCPPVRGDTIFHCDRGSQYMSKQFSDLLRSYGIRASVGRTGACWDNAWAESFNATVKNERVHRMAYPTKIKAIQDVESWIELIYN